MQVLEASKGLEAICTTISCHVACAFFAHLLTIQGWDVEIHEPTVVDSDEPGFYSGLLHAWNSDDDPWWERLACVLFSDARGIEAPNYLDRH